ncbi:DUF4398 domain-containing protein [Sorangium sp. So ce1000]|uniref:DUF4398 domain-containing protein n=1 Tax=Sorangium sp. So ce1000 TaxID=3133325 RepID=UPI003F60A3C6
MLYNLRVNRSPNNKPPLSRLASPAAVLAALLGLSLAACGGTVPPPNDQLASSQAAIRAADEMGAGSDPQATLHLKLAREQLEQAKQQMQAEENASATRLLQRAEADAELALALAKVRSTQAEAQEALKQVEKLKQAGVK